MNTITVWLVLAANMLIDLGMYSQHKAERRKKHLGRAMATVLGCSGGASDSEKLLLIEVRCQADTVTVQIPVRAEQAGIEVGALVPVRYLTSGRSVRDVYLALKGDRQVRNYEAASLGSYALAIAGYSAAILPYIM